MNLMHPHNTPEEKEKHQQAHTEWMEERWKNEVDCYTVSGFFREMKWMLLGIGLVFGLIWFWTRR